MKTQNNKLIFKSNTMVELNEEELLNIDGGTSLGCIGVAIIGAGIGAGIALLLR